jgi:hypothetical protein
MQPHKTRVMGNTFLESDGFLNSKHMEVVFCERIIVAESKTDEIVNVDRDLHIHAVWESNA